MDSPTPSWYNIITTIIIYHWSDYTIMTNYFQPQLPLNVGVLIEEDSPVYLVEEIVYSLDLSSLETRKKSKRGRPTKLSRRQLLAILFYAYMEGYYSSREIEGKLTRDTHYMYLSRNIIVSHTIINNFRKSLKDGIIEDLFIQFILKLHEIGEVKLETIFIDGTKIEANANRYTFVWKKAVDKNEAKLQEKVKKLLHKINETLGCYISFNEEEKITVELMYQVTELLKNYAKVNQIEFKYGKGNRKPQVQSFLEELEDYIIRQSNYDTSHRIFNGRNSYSKTDLSATFMRMKEDHMKNGQLKPGYNVQVGMEGGYVIGLDIFSNPNDTNTLIPFLTKLQESYKIKFKNVVTDSGYAGEKNYDFLDKNESRYFIPYQSYYMEQTRKFKNDIGKRQNMTYDAKKDVYICANNRELVYVKTIENKKDPDFTIKQKVYRSLNCKDCPLRSKCMPFSKKETSTKELKYSENFEHQKKKVLENIHSDEGIRLRVNRSIQAEGFFGVIKEDYDFRRFLLRGTEKVKLETLLIAFAFNLRRLHKKKLKGKIGQFIEYKIKAA